MAWLERGFSAEVDDRHARCGEADDVFADRVIFGEPSSHSVKPRVASSSGQRGKVTGRPALGRSVLGAGAEHGDFFGGVMLSAASVAACCSGLDVKAAGGAARQRP